MTIFKVVPTSELPWKEKPRSNEEKRSKELGSGWRGSFLRGFTFFVDKGRDSARVGNFASEGSKKKAVDGLAAFW